MTKSQSASIYKPNRKIQHIYFVYHTPIISCNSQ